MNSDVKKIADVLAAQYGVDNYDKKFGNFATEYLCGIVKQTSHEGREQWLVRFGAAVTFDRWANSTAIEELFDNVDDVIRFLNNPAHVYFHLFTYLSEEVASE